MINWPRLYDSSFPTPARGRAVGHRQASASGSSEAAGACNLTSTITLPKRSFYVPRSSSSSRLTRAWVFSKTKKPKHGKYYLIKTTFLPAQAVLNSTSAASPASHSFSNLNPVLALIIGLNTSLSRFSKYRTHPMSMNSCNVRSWLLKRHIMFMSCWYKRMRPIP